MHVTPRDHGLERLRATPGAAPVASAIPRPGDDDRARAGEGRIMPYACQARKAAFAKAVGVVAAMALGTTRLWLSSRVRGSSTRRNTGVGDSIFEQSPNQGRARLDRIRLVGDFLAGR